jgi:cation diffusion facilitator CzcD-associated flavoprotein CzcO
MPASSPRILIVGAGFSGLGAAIRLKRAGFHDLTVVDRGDEVGGTWRDNVYPGCACDVPSHLYSFSFDTGFDWDRPYARQPQILDYLRHLADKHGLRPHLRLRTEVRRATWIEARGVWQLQLAGGETLEGEVLVAGSGGLVTPARPAIEGLDGFKGPVFHSARWRHDIDLSGLRVALVGTGASAVQIAPELAPSVRQLHVFQRTAPWVLPRGDRPYGRLRRGMFRTVPGLRRLDRWRVYLRHELITLGFLGNRLFQWGMVRVALRHLRRQLAHDPALQARATPQGLPGCKRLLLSDTWYPTLARPNVSLVTEGIARIVPEGVVTQDGRLHAADAIVFGTGFSVGGGLSRTQGRQREPLGLQWQQQGARTHLGLAAHGFPNMFMLLGPGSGLGSNSVVFMLEAQLNYLVQAVRHLARTGAVLDLRPEVQADGHAELQRRMQRTVWVSGCKSWYQSADGRIDTLWPDFSFNYWRRTRRFDPGVYEVSLRPSPSGLPAEPPVLPAVP